MIILFHLIFEINDKINDETNDEKKTTLNSKNLTNQSSNISKYAYNMILDDATKINQIILDNNNSKNDEEQYDMLNDAKSEINVDEQYDMLNDAKSEINKEDEWVIIDNQSNVKNEAFM